MARNFVLASSQVLTTASSPVSALPCTIACWVKVTNLSGLKFVVVAEEAAAIKGYFLGVNGGVGLIQSYDGVNNPVVNGTAPYSTNTWTHLCGTLSAGGTTNVALYTNGAADGTSSATAATTTPNAVYIGAGNPLGPTYLDGDCAEVGIWNIVLTAAEVATLARGVSPLFVRPDALVGYWPLSQGYSPEIDLIGRRSATLSNAPLVSTHPRITVPAKMRTFKALGTAIISAVSSFAFSTVAALQVTATIKAVTSFAFSTVLNTLGEIGAFSAYLIQAGTALWWMSPSGRTTAITLPSSVTLYGTAAQPCRATLFAVGANPVVVVVNGGTKDFYVDTYGTARVLGVSAPISAPVVSAGTGTDLTGAYMVACTFKVKDSNGVTLVESGMGPLSTSVTVTAKTLALANVPVSGDSSVNARGVYRTLAGGNTLYPWFDIDNNTSLSEDRGVVDSLLSLLPTQATRYGAPPALKLITSWKGRLWGVPRGRPDFLRWTEDRNLSGWSADNEALMPAQAGDAIGCTALIPRRDDLGVGKRHALFTMRGNSNQSFQRVGISETLGPINQESVVVVYNTAYFLTDRGVAEWSDNGVGLISEAQVDGWFTTDTYFNREMFPYAQGRYNPDTDAYELLLASAGSTVLDRWVSYDLQSRAWLGPHKTDAFTPSSAGNGPTLRGGLTDRNSHPLAIFGSSDGYVYARDSDALTDYQTAVPLSVELPFLDAGEPGAEKVWLTPTVHTRKETSGELTVTPTVGSLEATASPPQYHPLTLGEKTLERLGHGRYAQLTLTHSATAERPRILGIELPYVLLGRRG